MTILDRAERTRVECGALLVEPGFAIDDVVATDAPTRLMVAHPV